MAVPVTVTTGALADPACFATEQERYEAYIAATDWEVPDGYLQWVVQAATPAAGDQDKAWLRVDANGYPIEALLWVTAANAWARWFDIPVYGGTTGGAANAYTLTLSPALTAYQQGKMYSFKASFTNTGGATLNINGVGAVDIEKPHNTALSAGDIQNGQIVVVIYDSTGFVMVSAPHQSSASHGFQIYTSGSGNFSVPAGVTQLDVECVGGGGGGGYKNAGPIYGGGGGGYCRHIWSVSPGDSIPYAVGAKGTKSTADGAGNATDGGDTTFNTTQIANGGSNGDAGLGVGGTYSTPVGGYGFDGTDGTWINATNRLAGGRAMHGASMGAECPVGTTDVRPATYGGGGTGDDDAAGDSSSDGAAGLIIIRY